MKDNMVQLQDVQKEEEANLKVTKGGTWAWSLSCWSKEHLYMST